MTPPHPAPDGPRVLCVGVITLDHVYTVTTPLTVGVKHRASERRDVGGGIAANAAVAVARLGGHSTLLGAIGTDRVGDAVLEELAAEGVGTDAIQRIDGAGTTESVVLIEPDGGRTIVAHAPIDLSRLPAPALPSGPFDAVLVDGRWPAATRAALEFARREGIPGVVDVDRAPTDERERAVLLEQATHLVCSEVGLAEFTGVEEIGVALRNLAADTGARVAVTTGSDGVTWLDGGERRDLDAFEVSVVDTTGAGDVFHGAFALAVAGGSDDEQAFRFASGVAAIKCSRPGARAGIPTRDEVESFLADRR